MISERIAAEELLKQLERVSEVERRTEQIHERILVEAKATRACMSTFLVVSQSIFAVLVVYTALLVCSRKKKKSKSSKTSYHLATRKRPLNG
jgi:hypothetical protein